MKKIAFLLFALSLFACDEKESDDGIDLRSTLGEITMKISLEKNRWNDNDLTVILTLRNDPKANPELEKYMKNVGGQDLPTELSVDWGDGTINGETTHTYVDYGSYKIVIKGRGMNWFSDEKNNFEISSLDVTKCQTLQGLIAGNSRTSVVDRTYDFSANPNLEYLDFGYTPFTKQINLSQNRRLKGLTMNGSINDIDYGIDLSTLSDLRFVLFKVSSEESFNKLSKSKSLNYLKFLYGCPTGVDFSGLSQLEKLVISNCNTSELDLSKNTMLKKIEIYHNHAHMGENQCPYNEEIVNAIYSKLPLVSGTLTTDIPFGDRSIAEKRGWKVVE